MRGEGAHRGDGPSSPQCLQGSTVHSTLDVDLDHLAELCLSGFSLQSYPPPPPPPRAQLFLGKSGGPAHTPAEVGELCPLQAPAEPLPHTAPGPLPPQ